jgi:RNA 2',3'-cyclic 3'-phosphodiesterase
VTPPPAERPGPGAEPAPSGEPTRRLFFALWPDEAQRAALVHATRKALRACGGRPVPAASLHVTLAFLGSVPESRMADLREVAHRTAVAFAPGAAPLTLSLERIGYSARGQLLWVIGREGRHDATSNAPGDAAQRLAAALKSATAAAGFSPDLKPFRTHVTVARKVAHAPAPQPMRPLAWFFDRFCLIESRTLSEGVAYSIVESYALDGADKVRAEGPNSTPRGEPGADSLCDNPE